MVDINKYFGSVDIENIENPVLKRIMQRGYRKKSDSSFLFFGKKRHSDHSECMVITVTAIIVMLTQNVQLKAERDVDRVIGKFIPVAMKLDEKASGS